MQVEGWGIIEVFTGITPQQLGPGKEEPRNLAPKGPEARKIENVSEILKTPSYTKVSRH